MRSVGINVRFTLGAGPIFLLPTATDELLGAGKWAAGPTGVVVWQGNGWTVGVLAWHNWSFAGEADRADVNETFLQPVSAYTTAGVDFYVAGRRYIQLGDWRMVGAGQLPCFQNYQGWGAAGLNVVGGVRYWMDSPDTGPHGFSGRLGMTFLFPTL